MSTITIRMTVPLAIVAVLALIFVPTASFAKTVGLILPRDCAFSPDTKEKFAAVLRGQGIAGKDLEIFLQRPGSDKVSRLNSIRKFLAIGADTIVVWGGTSLKEIASEAGKTPIVFIGAWDPVKSGIIKDLKSPGKYVTGVMGKTSMPYLIDNIIETASPKVLGVIYHSDVVDSMAQYDDLKGVAAGKGLDLVAIDARGLTPASASATLAPAEFLYLAQGCAVEGGVYTALAGLNKPGATQNPGVTGGGVVFTLAPDMDETIKVAAEITGRILKGEKPGDIPVARIKKISFIINMGEARKLGLKIPFGVLNRGTEIIR
jgi:putative ABC transport system substrate-binding protein